MSQKTATPEHTDTEIAESDELMQELHEKNQRDADLQIEVDKKYSFICAERWGYGLTLVHGSTYHDPVENRMRTKPSIMVQAQEVRLSTHVDDAGNATYERVGEIDLRRIRPSLLRDFAQEHMAELGRKVASKYPGAKAELDRLKAIMTSQNHDNPEETIALEELKLRMEIQPECGVGKEYIFQDYLGWYQDREAVRRAKSQVEQAQAGRAKEQSERRKKRGGQPGRGTPEFAGSRQIM